MPTDLTNRAIIITGASAGIGAATAIACARAGMDLVLNARREDKLRAVADQIESIGRTAELVIGDVTDAGMSQRLIDAAYARFDRLDAAFANAGYGFEKPQHELEDEELRRIFDVNFFASFELLRAAARTWIERGEPGHGLMCSSVLALFTMPSYAAYSATKACQHHFCRAMNFELRAHRIHVTSVHPTSTATEFSQVSRSMTDKEPVEIEAIAPRRMIQSPQRVAGAIVKCLRQPRPEVWTSRMTRVFGAMTCVWAALFDIAARRYVMSKYNR